ncbi:MAG: flippase-like domain-containing protein [Nitrospirae bacterium]|nr:flippase-like domain-containing protein [Nitrospirota bacterium]
MKKTITTIIKALISIALMVYLFSKIDIMEVWHLFQNVKVPYLTAALFLYITGQVICAWRWRIIAFVMDFKNSYWEFIKYYFAGMFFSLFLPTLVGGDIGRCYLITKGNKKIREAIVSVLADRGTGLAVLFLMAGLSVTLLKWGNIPQQLVWGVLIADALLVIGILLPFFAGGLLNIMGKTGELALNFWKKPSVLFQSILISMLFQTLIIIIHVFIGLSIGMQIPWTFYFFLIPLVATVSMLPLSISGIGLREGAFVYFFSYANVPKTEALTFAFGWFVIVLIASLIGGLGLLISKNGFSWKQFRKQETNPADM